MKSDILLSIVIVTWNTKSKTIDCLYSIINSADYKQLSERIELIVIDNNSFDDTTFQVKNLFPFIKLIINKENVGYAPACNQGMRASSGKYVLLLGSDTLITNNSLIKCLEFLENNMECAAVGCKLIFPDGRAQGNCKKFPTLKNGVFAYLSLNSLNYDYDMLWFNYDETLEVDQIATTFLMTRNVVLKKINYFDEKFRILYNDVDLCKKIWDTGSKIFFLHTAKVIHHGSFSTKRANSAVRKIMYKDIFRYYKNYYGFSAIILIPILFFRFFVVSLSKMKNVTN